MRLFNTAKGLRRKMEKDLLPGPIVTGGYGFTLRNDRFRLDIREKHLMIVVVGHRLPREVVDASPLEVYKALMRQLIQ